MKRLSGLDTAFLSMEVPSAPMHVASIIVLDPSTVEGGVGPAQLRSLYEQRIHLAPPFRRRLVEVPFGIHHPVWIEDPDFDLDFHLRHIAVPAPGTMDELSALAGHLVAMPLDRRRPLWEVWLIDGLENGHVALLSKVHHAAIDGASGEELMIAILDLSPEIEQKPPPETPWVPDKVPTETELFGYAAYSLAQNPFKMMRATRRTLEAAFQIRQTNRRGGTKPPPAPFTAPRTSINQPLTPHRYVATATLSLPDVKMIKNTFGVTVNDVILSVCGGALRHYLDGRDEHPDRALVGFIPVSVRTEDKKGHMGNEVSAMLTTLATDIDDPLERLLAINAGTRRSKEQFNTIGADTLQNWTEFAAPALLGRAARLYSRMKVADVHRPAFNLLVSNVPGPPFPLYVSGGLVKAVYPIGPIYDGVGVNMTVMSYMDSLDFGINTCPEVLPEPWRLTDGLHRALDDLKKAAEAHTDEPADATPEPPPAPAPAPEAKATAEATVAPLPGEPIDIVLDEPDTSVPAATEPVATPEPVAPVEPVEPPAPTVSGTNGSHAPNGSSPATTADPAMTETPKPPARRTPAKRSPAKRSPAKKAATAKATAPTAGAKKAPAKRAPAKRATAKKAATSAAATKPTATRAAAKKSASRTTAGKTPAKRATPAASRPARATKAAPRSRPT
jgi:diacylglycerol O-acyltransferase